MFPIHINLGFTVIYNYEGIYFFIAILLGVLLGTRRVNRIESSPQMNNFVFISLIAAIIGTRLSHFIFWNFEILLRDPLSIITSSGGASIVGGLYSGILAGYIFARIKKMDFYSIFGSISPVILLSQAVGRIGCFLNSDAHGVRTNLPWGIRFPKYGFILPDFKFDHSVPSVAWYWSFQQGLIDPSSLKSAKVHPTQLYESFLDLFLMGIIIFYSRVLKKNSKNLQPILYMHIGGYALIRFLLEFIRADRAQVIGGFISVLQIVLFTVFLASAALFIKYKYESRQIPA